MKFITPDGKETLFFQEWFISEFGVRHIYFMDGNWKLKAVISIREFELQPLKRITIQVIRERVIYSEVLPKDTDPMQYAMFCIGDRYNLFFTFPRYLEEQDYIN